MMITIKNSKKSKRNTEKILNEPKESLLKTTEDTSKLDIFIFRFFLNMFIPRLRHKYLKLTLIGIHCIAIVKYSRKYYKPSLKLLKMIWNGCTSNSCYNKLNIYAELSIHRPLLSSCWIKLVDWGKLITKCFQKNVKNV